LTFPGPLSALAALQISETNVAGWPLATLPNPSLTNGVPTSKDVKLGLRATLLELLDPTQLSDDCPEPVDN